MFSLIDSWLVFYKWLFQSCVVWLFTKVMMMTVWFCSSSKSRWLRFSNYIGIYVYVYMSCISIQERILCIKSLPCFSRIFKEKRQDFVRFCNGVVVNGEGGGRCTPTCYKSFTGDSKRAIRRLKRINFDTLIYCCVWTTALDGWLLFFVWGLRLLALAGEAWSELYEFDIILHCV